MTASMSVMLQHDAGLDCLFVRLWAAVVRTFSSGGLTVSNVVPSHVVWLEPWRPLPQTDDALAQELHRECSMQHVLYGVKVIAVARRTDCDDVLFAATDPSGSLAVVHLTWRGLVEPDPRWPSTTFYQGWQEWIDYCLIPEHAEYSERTREN
jgi:hypothetical protein